MNPYPTSPDELVHGAHYELPSGECVRAVRLPGGTTWFLETPLQTRTYVIDRHGVIRLIANRDEAGRRSRVDGSDGSGAATDFTVVDLRPVAGA